MSFFEKFGKKTVKEVVDATTSTVNMAMKGKTEDILSFFPIAVSLFLVFSGGKHERENVTIIHNHYEGVMPNAEAGDKGYR